MAHILRSYEAALPRHNIPLASDTYFYRVLIRLSLNCGTPSWRVRLIAECQRARQSYGPANRSATRSGRDGCAAGVGAIDKDRAGQKRRQTSVPRAPRARPKRARSLSGLPAPPHPDRGQLHSTSPAGRQPLVSFRDRDGPDSGQRTPRSRRVVCDGVGCSRSREQSPERLAASLGDWGRRQGSASRPPGRASVRSCEQSPEPAAVHEVLRQWGSRSSSPARRRSASAAQLLHRDADTNLRTAWQALQLGCDATEPQQACPGAALRDITAPRARRRSCQLCLQGRSTASGDSSGWDAPLLGGFSESGVEELTCPGCGQAFEPANHAAPSGRRQLWPSPERGVSLETRLAPHKLDQLRELIRQWRGTAHAATCGLLATHSMLLCRKRHKHYTTLCAVHAQAGWQ